METLILYLAGWLAVLAVAAFIADEIVARRIK